MLIKSLTDLALAVESGISLEFKDNHHGIWEKFDIDSYVFRDIRKFIAKDMIRAKEE
jgi:hypothetical protein